MTSEVGTPAPAPGRRPGSRTRVVLAGLAGLLALWSGFTAPSVSPVAPTAGTAVVQDAADDGTRLSGSADLDDDGRSGRRGQR